MKGSFKEFFLILFLLNFRIQYTLQRILVNFILVLIGDRRT